MWSLSLHSYRYLWNVFYCGFLNMLLYVKEVHVGIKYWLAHHTERALRQGVQQFILTVMVAEHVMKSSVPTNCSSLNLSELWSRTSARVHRIAMVTRCTLIWAVKRTVPWQFSGEESSLRSVGVLDVSYERYTRSSLSIVDLAFWGDYFVGETV